MNTNSTLSLKMDQESFALDGLRPNSTTNLFGVIQIHSEPLCFISPLWAQVQLIGREQIGNSTQIIVNDTYHLSSHPGDWQPSSSSGLLSSSPNGIEGVVYSLPFNLSVPSNMPISFQIYDQEQDFVCCGIYYILEVRVSSIGQGVIQPIHFHRSSIRRQSLQSNNSSIYDAMVIKNEVEEKEAEEDAMPKRIFWGITKQSKQRWQYELEFPNTFDLVTSKSGSASIRLRSIYGNRKEMKDNCCCLIGCQIIQLIHLEGHQSHVQVLATATKLLTSPNTTWSQACQVEFELDDPVLPTVDNERLGVEHCIRISIEFCNTASESDSCSMDLQFPVVFTGCLLNKTRRQVGSKNKPTTTVTNRKRATSSVSSCSSLGEISSYDCSIIPSCKSLRNYLHSYKLKI